MSYLFISHDLALVSSICDRILVLYRGQIVESGTAEEIIQHAAHPYTKVLLDSVFLVDKENANNKKIVNVMEAANRADCGCPYASKCRAYQEGCSSSELISITETHAVRCSRFK